MPELRRRDTMQDFHSSACQQLRRLGREIQRQVIAARGQHNLSKVDRSTAADTIYAIDTVVEPILEEFCREWSKTTPLVLIAEGIENELGEEGVKVFPEGSRAEDAQIRLIVDPIDGTRGLMYDKRSAWSLAGVAPNRGKHTLLSDIEVAVMTELPTSKMGFADTLSAIRDRGASAQRTDLRSGDHQPLAVSPSGAPTIDHGFVSISNFFPGTKVLASELIEHLIARLIGPADVTRATVFDDQYISTGGQWYELIVGHDRFNADLRPLFYRMQGQPEGMCCHPYDCAALLIAQEAGVIITDGFGKPLDGPLDCITGMSWAGYANPTLQALIEPILREFLISRGAKP